MRNLIIVTTLLATLVPAAVMAQLPDPGLTVAPGRTALVITDPQNDFLSPEGVTWGVVGESVTTARTPCRLMGSRTPVQTGSSSTSR